MKKLFTYTVLFFCSHGFADDGSKMVDIKTINSSIFVEAAYFTDWNFIGRPVAGYLANVCYLTEETAKKLSLVQEEVAKLGLSLLVFDCYRPEIAVKEFVNWVRDPADTKMKTVFYPEEAKSQLIKRGYIASRSGHTRGNTIDLTLVKTEEFQKLDDFLSKAKEVKDCRESKKVKKSAQLDMGTTYDCFDELSHTASKKVSSEARKNRKILKSAMENHGFKNYSKEWWHFSR